MISALYPGGTCLRVALAALQVVTALDDLATASSTASEQVGGGEVKGGGYAMMSAMRVVRYVLIGKQ